LIPFEDPKVGPNDAEKAIAFQKLSGCLEAASSMAGSIVKIEKDFKDSGYTEILNVLNPILYNTAGPSNPRVVTGCSILLYFTYKVCTYGLRPIPCGVNA